MCMLLQVFPEFFLHCFFLLHPLLVHWEKTKNSRKDIWKDIAYSNPTHITLILFG